ncbi:MAG: PAS domain S-box protein [Desulfobacteraceae bacterium]|nr:PAS domain S-box protein [Desulfobacteraceae bacterium]
MDRLSNTIRLGLRYAMMINSRDDIEQIINNIALQNDIENIRIYNKLGQIKYSNHFEEIDVKTNIKAEACYICHNSEPPITQVNLSERVRIIHSGKGYRLMGIISPVYNEKGCSADNCHVHPSNKKVLGALDLVVSLKHMDHEITFQQRSMIIIAVAVFIGIGGMIVFIIVRFVTNPINKLINGAQRIEQGDYNTMVRVNQKDEIQELARAINQMGQSIGNKTEELNKQKDEFQNLFEMVPCIISVQNLDYRLIGYNREFAKRFDSKIGEYCYKVYKGREERCVVCPVQKTFADGKSHYSEESGIDRDGTVKHWIVRTTPIRDDNGNIVAAMEMNLDITERKQLEQRLEQSEDKYYAIFNTIPNPVFVLNPESMEILDCNNSVTSVYGYIRQELIGKSFFDFFGDAADHHFITGLKGTAVVERAKHRSKYGQTRYVTIRMSPSEYGGHQVLLVTIGDITKSLEAEQQLIQASKMATLGEMATGVAHELNQPLSVIKTASSYFMRKVRKKEPIKPDILETMAEQIDRHVVRASKIIKHMRQFGRKSDDIQLQPVHIGEVLEQASELFSQQLKVRGINVVWDIDKHLPAITADAGRLEQVLINLLINARDAIEDKWGALSESSDQKQIVLSAKCSQGQVVLSVCDTGTGIHEDYLEKIFEPFFTTKKVGQGTGLGLSISYGIIKECGGRIYAQPNPGGGVCFIIEIPAHEVQ